MLPVVPCPQLLDISTNVVVTKDTSRLFSRAKLTAIQLVLLKHGEVIHPENIQLLIIQLEQIMFRKDLSNMQAQLPQLLLLNRDGGQRARQRVNEGVTI